MPNPYFNFKQFTIYQDNCAMKVCTDACLFGAWVATKLQNLQPHTMLDIGSGTGLLTLMLAQQLDGKIDTIEIDTNAYLQAAGNIIKSKWSERITATHADIKEYNFKHQYDLIISNPPFYENDLRTAKHDSNMARHEETLTLKVLLSVASLNLTSNGSFAVLIPYYRYAYCISAADEVNLYPSSVVHVKQTTHHNYFRSMIVFKKHLTANINKNEMSIKDGINYTPAFTELLKDYYLNL